MTSRFILLSLVLTLLGLGNSGCTRAAKRDRHFEKATAFLQAGQYENAEIEFLNVMRLEKQPRPAVLSGLGQIYQVQGKTTRALKFLTEARKLDATHLDTRIQLALAYLGLRQVSNALEEVEFVLKHQPTHGQALEILADTAITTNQVKAVLQRLLALRPQADSLDSYHIALGRTHFRDHNLAAAETHYRRAAELNPKSNSAYWGLGSVLLAHTNAAAAEAMFKTALELTPIRSPQRLNYANHKILSGDAETGKRLIRETAEKAPDFLPALTRLASLHLAETNYAECEALLKKILKQDSTNVEAMLLSARVQLTQGHRENAVAQVERLRDLYPNGPAVYYHLAGMHLANADTDKAVVNLKQAVSLHPDFAEATYLLAEIQIRRKDATSAIMLLESFLKRNPTAAHAQFLLAQAHHAGGRPEEALKLCTGLVDRGLKDPRIHLFAGMILRQQAKPREAAAAFDKALDMAPGFLPALQQRLALDVQAKQWTAALDRVLTRIAQNPDSAPLQFLLATVHLAKGDFTSTETALLKAIELNPETSEFYQMLARVYLLSKQAPKALAKLDERLARKPGDVSALLTKALIYERLEDHAAARKAYEQLLALRPDNSAFQNNLAYLLSEKFGELDPALDLARKAHQSRPGDPAIMDTLGWILFRRGDYGDAVKLLRESTSQLGQNPESLFHFGMAAAMVGDESAATTALQHVLEAGTNFAGYHPAQQRLALMAIPHIPADAKAIADLETALGKQPGDAVAAARLAAVHEQARAWDKARAIYEKALERNPAAVPLLLGLARLHAEQFGAPSKALELARQGRDLAPHDPKTAHGFGRIAYQAKDYRGALAPLEESAERLNDPPDVLYDLAWCYYSLGRVPEAAATMQKVIRATPAFTRAEDARRFVTMIQLAQEPPAQTAAAAPRVQTALESYPDDPPTLMAAAAVYQAQGNATGARQMCLKVLSLFPDFAPAHKQLAVLYLQVPVDFDKAETHALKARQAFPGDPTVAEVLKAVEDRRKDTTKAGQLLRDTYK